MVCFIIPACSRPSDDTETHKDRYTVETSPYILRRDGKDIFDDASHYPGIKKHIKKTTNRTMRHSKANLANGGAYKKHFCSLWHIL
jgi:hypothetical protein